MDVVERRLELLKLEGSGFNRPEIVKALSDKYGCNERTIHYDFQHRSKWQPTLQQVKDNSQVLMKVINRYEAIYRKAALMNLTASNENNRLGALKIMLDANAKVYATLLPQNEVGDEARPFNLKIWRLEDAKTK